MLSSPAAVPHRGAEQLHGHPELPAGCSPVQQGPAAPSLQAPCISTRLIYRNLMFGAASASCQTSLTLAWEQGKQLVQQQGNPCLSISGLGGPFASCPEEEEEEKDKEEKRRKHRPQPPSWHHLSSPKEGDTRGYSRVCTRQESPAWAVS